MMWLDLDAEQWAVLTIAASPLIAWFLCWVLDRISLALYAAFGEKIEEMSDDE